MLNSEPAVSAWFHFSKMGLEPWVTVAIENQSSGPARPRCELACARSTRYRAVPEGNGNLGKSQGTA
jgi:hypothetical protein